MYSTNAILGGTKIDGKVYEVIYNLNINRMEQEFISVSLIEINEGQIEGVPSNPRTISKEKMEALKRSIQNLPDMLSMRELLVYPLNGKYIVLGGNMWYLACLSLGYKELPCKIIPKDIPSDKLRAIVMQDNNQFGQTDWDLIANEWDLDELKDWGVDLPSDWQNAEEPKQAKSDDFSDDDIAEEGEPRSKIGDIWLLGEHRLMCGDSTDPDMVARLMDGEKADMVFTDPPYGVSIGDKNAALNSVDNAGRRTTNIANDNISVDELYPILVKAMTNCRENCKDSASYFVTSPQGGELGLMMMMMKDAGLTVRHMLIWVKNNATFSLGRLDYDYQHEPIFYTWTKSHKNYRNGEYRTTIWKYDKPMKCDLHPTMKPVELVANCLNDCTINGDIVLDMFGGSGTTLIACEQLGRKARLMELDPKYVDVIISRWEKLTGMKAELQI